MSLAVQIVGWDQLAETERCTASPDPVFFAASNTQEFDNPEHRTAFRELWLGQFLAAYPDLAAVALGADGGCLGYCVVWPEDPRKSGDFSDLGYFTSVGDALDRFPAHLHINLSADVRGLGLGSRLLHAALSRLGEKQPHLGVHIFTEATARNRGFYTRNAFSEIASVPWRDRRLVMMARSPS